MFLVDTNVVSELRRPRRANPNVLEWAGATPIGDLYLSVITVMELEVGVLRMERRDAAQGAILRTWLDGALLPRFGDRILEIDVAVVLCCAPLHVPDKRPDRDALIAATAIAHRLTIATRNTADFISTGAKLVNPWAPPPA